MRKFTLALLTTTIFIMTPAQSLETPPTPNFEFRGAWIATVMNIDWPSKPTLSTQQQQDELRGLLDRAVDLKLNAVVFQVRPACDALYASTIEPWSPFLTGQMGQAPAPLWDPLKFAVIEAHARGLELHAWFNPFRARAADPKKFPVSENHVSKIHPEWIRQYGEQLWLDPGEKAARDYSIKVVLDVVRRYDIDGVHIDDYFYPYPKQGKGGSKISFPDDTSFARSGLASEARDDWRRANINDFVEKLYRGIKAEKKWVKFGISPFGIWRSGQPATISGLDAYNEIYADSRRWINEGWADYFSPQLYWKIDPAKQSFPVLLDWWKSQNTQRRHIWPGLATERVGQNRKPDEIIKQIQITRKEESDPGHIHWSIKNLLHNPGGLAEQLQAGLYADLALVPASPWLGRDVIDVPTLSQSGAQVKLQSKQSPRWWLVQFHVENKWIARRIPGTQTSFAILPNSDAVTVRSVDREGNLGEIVTSP